MLCCLFFCSSRLLCSSFPSLFHTFLLPCFPSAVLLFAGATSVSVVLFLCVRVSCFFVSWFSLHPLFRLSVSPFSLVCANPLSCSVERHTNRHRRKCLRQLQYSVRETRPNDRPNLQIKSIIQTNKISATLRTVHIAVVQKRYGSLFLVVIIMTITVPLALPMGIADLHHISSSARLYISAAPSLSSFLHSVSDDPSHASVSVPLVGLRV